MTLFEARTKDRRVLCGPLWPRGQKASLYVFLSRHKNLCLRSESLEDQDPTRDTPGREEGCEASVTLAQAQWNFQNLTFKATPENKLTLDTSALTPPPWRISSSPGIGPRRKWPTMYIYCTQSGMRNPSVLQPMGILRFTRGII